MPGEKYKKRWGGQDRLTVVHARALEITEASIGYASFLMDVAGFKEDVALEYAAKIEQKFWENPFSPSAAAFLEFVAQYINEQDP